jgi:hypothetical protein
MYCRRNSHSLRAFSQISCVNATVITPATGIEKRGPTLTGILTRGPTKIGRRFGLLGLKERDFSMFDVGCFPLNTPPSIFF